MLEQLAGRWWVFVVRGVLAILFGIATFVIPGVTLAVLVTGYGLYALADGVVGVMAAFGRRVPGDPFPWSVLLIGAAGIAAGVVTLVYPGVTALVLLYLIALWHVVRGLFEIVVAVRLRQLVDGEGWLIAAGIMSVLFGGFLFLRPGAGALAVLWLIGAFAVLFGIVVIALGLRLRHARPARA